ncbi:winged helix-turn-helix domain-containing protein [Haloarcula sp. Atlit-7R]|uniref:winged helix-turn-helix domain-containing protein n=1 Tax=Haloarcula sp. Atlit-7R TaxID=2282125 RepID=UPI000EF15F33|nr:winged helix-turn-helix domain-containing protein [Haloarcula sp. Atlit-7R]RLM96985.1 ArsR family transcriptional regulator [Haloarcula sp. Atlit-7R]
MGKSREPDTENEETVTEEHLLFGALGDHPKTKTLAALINAPEKDFNITEIADYADIKRDTVYKYIDELRAWGLIEKTRKVGNSQMYALNTDSDAAEALSEMEWHLMEHLAEKEAAGELDIDNNPVPE